MDVSQLYRETYFRYENENKNENDFFSFYKKLKPKRLVFKKRKRYKNKNDSTKQLIKITTIMNTGTKKVSI